ncbi:MAG TPA: FAD-binding protein, partial [Candidatus Limnocylindria bacterium]
MALQTRNDIAARLRAVLPADRVIDDPATLEPYAYDASFWSLRMQHRPDVVVVPETTAEVAATMRVADETGTPIVPRGAGTGQTGGAVAA